MLAHYFLMMLQVTVRLGKIVLSSNYYWYEYPYHFSVAFVKYDLPFKLI